MCAFQLLLSVDPSLGRVDHSLLSDQTLMEMLFDGFDDKTKNKYKDNNGMYLDVCKWSRITCDDDQRVIQIDSMNINGSLELCYVPPKVKEFRVNPSWSWNKLTGSVDLTHLPVGLQVLDLRSNKLTGEIDLTQLPREMYFLDLQNNQLSGEIDLAHLSDGMRYLQLKNNKFSGGIDLTHLPHAMKELHLYGNQLSGSLVIRGVPPRMKVIDVRGNHFNAMAVIDSKSHVDIKLEMGSVTSVVDKSGREQDMNRFSK